MSYQPQFTITPSLLTQVEAVAALRERILGAAVELTWIPALQKDTRTRNVHASTAIEGNPLTLEQVRALEEGRELATSGVRAKREVVNYFAGLRYVEKRASMKRIGHNNILELHRILAGEVMDQGEAGRYRTISVRVGRYVPPPPSAVSGLMFELLEWWNKESVKLSPVLSSAILHYRFETIHPFADGNGRTGRALALWELYRRGFDTHHIFSVDEYYWEDRPRYYKELDAVRKAGEDLTGWLEYCAEGLQQTLEPDAGARVVASANPECGEVRQTGAAPPPGAVAQSPARSPQHGAERNMERARHFQAGGDGPAAPAAGRGPGRKSGRQENRTLRPQELMNSL